MRSGETGEQIFGMDERLIFDVGMYRGEDTAFYLKKGFRVIGVEADPDLCRLTRERFTPEIAAGRLTVVNKAVSDASGPVTLYKNTSYATWNTIRPEWAERNRELGTDSIAVEVEAVTLRALIERFGTPYYLKIDIEGMDLAALESIADQRERPKYASIESDKNSFRALRHEFDVFRQLGYNAFKIVPQHDVPRQKPPKPAREGQSVDFTFEDGATGLFGEEAPGPWMSAGDAIEAYRPIFLRYALTGDESFVTNRYLRVALRHVGFRAGWYDTHARLAPDV